jgi:hypothetical protein
VYQDAFSGSQGAVESQELLINREIWRLVLTLASNGVENRASLASTLKKLAECLGSFSLAFPPQSQTCVEPSNSVIGLQHSNIIVSVTIHLYTKKTRF